MKDRSDDPSHNVISCLWYDVNNVNCKIYSVSFAREIIIIIQIEDVAKKLNFGFLTFFSFFFFFYSCLKKLLKVIVENTDNVRNTLLIKEGNVSFNNTLNIFYLWLFGIGHIVNDH